MVLPTAAFLGRLMPFTTFRISNRQPGKGVKHYVLLVLLFPHVVVGQDVLPRLLEVLGPDSARVVVGDQAADLQVGQHWQGWTLMHVLPAKSGIERSAQVVLEDFTRFEGRLLIVDRRG